MGGHTVQNERRKTPWEADKEESQMTDRKRFEISKPGSGGRHTGAEVDEEMAGASKGSG